MQWWTRAVRVGAGGAGLPGGPALRTSAGPPMSALGPSAEAGRMPPVDRQSLAEQPRRLDCRAHGPAPLRQNARQRVLHRPRGAPHTRRPGAAAALHARLDRREPLGVGRRPSAGEARGRPSNTSLVRSASRRPLTPDPGVCTATPHSHLTLTYFLTCPSRIHCFCILIPAA